MIITVNNKKIEAKPGEYLLDTLRREGFNIPTLCHMKDFFPSGACRMCLVEDLNTGKLITSCSVPVTEGMNILTNSQRVYEARKTIIELLLSNHPDDCLYCVRNQNCELQKLSADYNINERRIRGQKNSFPVDRSSTSIVRDPEKCILCGRCVRVCEEQMGVACIDFVNRGSQTFIGTALKKGLNLSSCINCGQCIMVCPTGALTEKSHLTELLEMLQNKNKTVVVQYAPSISVSIAEEFNLQPGLDINGLLNAALRKIGFDFVFDTTFSADLTIMEEGTELINRIKNGGKLPLFTSCCPGWVKFAEQFAHDFLDNLSTCKSPQQMAGAVIKTYFAKKINVKPEDIYSVSIMPCTAKKFEGQRVEMTHDGYSDLDCELTTRELVKLIKMMGIDITKLEPEMTDTPFGTRTSAGKLFGASGGVAEAAIRTVYYLLTGQELKEYRISAIRGMDNRKETKIKIGDLEIGVAVVHGMAQARKLLDEIRNGRNDLHFVEFMACPGGCVGGGGQPIKMDIEAIKTRMKSLYQIDDIDSIKVSHKNPDVIKLYEEFLEHPNSHIAHEILHTHYQKRNVIK